MLRECPKCKRTYEGSMVGSIHQVANPENKNGYFGGYCDCGAKLGESYSMEGIEIVEGGLNQTKRVYSSDWLKWKKALSDKEFQATFGGPRKHTISIFYYQELFLAASPEKAKKKFLKLVKILKAQIIGRARLALARLYGEKWTGEKEVWFVDYQLQTASFHESVRDYLQLKRQKLGVKQKQ